VVTVVTVALPSVAPVAPAPVVTVASRSVEEYPKDAFPTNKVYGDLDHPGLRVITCGGSFDHAARSYVDNIVVYADLQ